MEAYLDNAATTRAYDCVREVMVKLLQEDYGNPSSMHTVGLTAENYIRQAKEDIAKICKVQPKEIIFTSGGTEANNMALIGAAMAYKRAGNHIITTSIEHASVMATMKYLEEQGFRITYLKVDKKGEISLEQLQQEICDDTILVSIMYVNNEIGSVQPMEQIVKTIKNTKSDVLLHVDAIQAFGKMEIYPGRMGIDMMSVSGHKIHGSKGSGFLYIRDKVKVKPLIHGGGQENGMRSGTENVPAIAGLAEAAKMSYENLNDKVTKMCACKDYLIDRFLELEDVTVNSQKGNAGAPHIVSASFAGVRSEVLLHSLEEQGIYCSAGSACSSNKPAVSATLKSIGVKKELLDSTLRFSLSEDTTMEQLDYTVETIKNMLGRLRIFRRK